MLVSSSSWLKTDVNCEFRILALVLLSENTIPSEDFRGATPDESHFFPFMKLQNLFGLLLESGLTMSVRKLLYACLHSDLHCDLRCWYLLKSFAFLEFLAFAKLLFFRLVRRFTVVVIHGWLNREDVILDGTCLSRRRRRVDLMSSHKCCELGS